ncbi:hypothetical protein N9937_01645 [bacterium]|nr:hypothetical protein [bacterium]
MKRILAILILLAICTGCGTFSGPCVRIANKYQRIHAAYGEEVGIVHHIVLGEFGRPEWNDEQDAFAGHAINFTEDEHKKRTYIDAGYPIPRIVPEPKCIVYDSSGTIPEGRTFADYMLKCKSTGQRK